LRCWKWAVRSSKILLEYDCEEECGEWNRVRPRALKIWWYSKIEDRYLESYLVHKWIYCGMLHILCFYSFNITFCMIGSMNFVLQKLVLRFPLIITSDTHALNFSLPSAFTFFTLFTSSIRQTKFTYLINIFMLFFLIPFSNNCFKLYQIIFSIK